MCLHGKFGEMETLCVCTKGIKAINLNYLGTHGLTMILGLIHMNVFFFDYFHIDANVATFFIVFLQNVV